MAGGKEQTISGLHNTNENNGGKPASEVDDKIEEEVRYD